MEIGSGTVLGHYRIVELLGKGGMGEVWRARDTRLKREVALKVLPAEMASDPVRLKRFQHEAETVAQLTNPHIVTLHTVEEENEVRFLTMELVEGQSLDHCLEREGLPLETIFRIGIGVADALAAAHEKHIVHRDLKPANIIMGRSGVVKVLDFGLAKLADRDQRPAEDVDTQIALTDEGVVMGTLPYMSPEQVRGVVIDHRSDIFSLGIVLYELVTGRRPFHGKTVSDLTSSILRDIPQPIDEIRPEVPRHLGRIIERCLEKEPDRRTQSALDIRNELEALRTEISQGRVSSVPITKTVEARIAASQRSRVWIGAAAIVTVLVIVVAFAVWEKPIASPERDRPPDGTAMDVAENSIAVLPFVDMSPEQDQEYFSDGISEELLNLLAKIPELRVAARTSSFSFKGKNEPIPEIARKLNVAHVLEGSVRKSGNRVRVTAQLIHGADGYHLWSETWDRELDDIFAIQDDIAAQVVDQLQVEILGTVPHVRTTDPAAYELYLQARDLGARLDAEALDQSDSLLDRVLETDPAYAPAWNQLAQNFNNRVALGLLSGTEGYTRAEEAAMRALEADRDYAPAHAKLGWIAMIRNDLDEAVQHFERARSLDPSDPSVLGSSAMLLDALGRPKEALALRQANVRRDPMSMAAHYDVGLSYLHTGQLDDAIDSWRKVLSLSPGRPVAHYAIGEALLLSGNARGALEEFEAETSEPYRMIGLPMAHDALGRHPDADAALEALIAKYGRHAAYNIAYVYAFRGNSDEAFAWLDRAIEYRDPGLFDIAVEPLFARIRNDPRWVPTLERIGKAPHQLEEIRFDIEPQNQ